MTTADNPSLPTSTAATTLGAPSSTMSTIPPTTPVLSFRTLHEATHELNACTTIHDVYKKLSQYTVYLTQSSLAIIAVKHSNSQQHDADSKTDHDWTLYLQSQPAAASSRPRAASAASISTVAQPHSNTALDATAQRLITTIDAENSDTQKLQPVSLYNKSIQNNTAVVYSEEQLRRDHDIREDAYFVNKFRGEQTAIRSVCCTSLVNNDESGGIVASSHHHTSTASMLATSVLYLENSTSESAYSGDVYDALQMLRSTAVQRMHSLQTEQETSYCHMQQKDLEEAETKLAQSQQDTAAAIKRAEEARAHAEYIAQTKGNFLSNMSHGK